MISTGYEVMISGFVQGRGIRPALARLAAQHQWSGSVRNTPHGVLLILQNVGVEPGEVEHTIRQAHPSLTTASITLRTSETCASNGFRIDESETEGRSVAPLPHDVAVCSNCLEEFHDLSNRRFGYGLISCTRCGPRFSMMHDMPFDRSRTTLSPFTMCSRCRREYDSTEDRRGHAQSIGCPDCGPQIWVAGRDQKVLASNDAACQIAAKALLQGRILALCGIGGYQLLVDATNEAAVSELRRRKRRPTKPFAVLCRNCTEAESLAILDAVSLQSLTSEANPIVLVPRHADSPLAPSVHPFLNDVGILLPTTAVHDRLLQLVARPLVCTSGNAEGAALATTVQESHAALSSIADLWLHHNRPIANPIDDSVVRPMAGRAVTLRCARGLTPHPLDLPNTPATIALGGSQKAALAWSNGVQAALGPHIGDLNDLSIRDRWQQSLATFARIYRIADHAWVTDAHPDDVPRLSIPSDVKPLSAWHHHAHIVAGMLEHGWLDRPVMGVAADGQGYGIDGTLWGGEVLWATATNFRRIARVRPYALPGGETAVVEPGRVAVALLSQLPDLPSDVIAHRTRYPLARIRALQQSLRSPQIPWTSSLGRLFDGIASLVLGPEIVGYIGEPAARWESTCDPRTAGQYSWMLYTDQEPWELDWRPALNELLRDLARGESPGIIAERFHRGVIDWIREVHRRCPPLPLVVSGGVFQNRRLCELLQANWPSAGAPLGLPGRIPPNDGGLAAGQLAIASTVLRSGNIGPKC